MAPESTSYGVQTLSGGVSNSGKITATSGTGIAISKSSSATVLGSTSASGSVVNSGTISAAKGIVVQADTIAGAIINANVIVAKGDPFAHSDGIVVRGVGTFLGGVSNRGSISAGHIGIEFGKSTTNAFGVSSVVGSIVNSGTITAKTGIALFASTITGAIIDSGSIKATSHGILINAEARSSRARPRSTLPGRPSPAASSNSGVVSGSAGILIKSAHSVSIFDGGVIVGTGGTAIEFAGSGNTLTLGAGYSIGGTVDPSGKNTFQLGGSGSDTFDLSSIGPQYLGFTTFNVVGGTWTVTSASTAHWTIKSGSLEIASGGELTSTTVSSGGVLVIESGGTASSSFVKAGGTEIIELGAIVSGAIISNGGTVELVGGIALPSSVQLCGRRHPRARRRCLQRSHRQQRPHRQNSLRRHRSGCDRQRRGHAHRRRRRHRQRGNDPQGWRRNRFRRRHRNRRQGIERRRAGRVLRWRGRSDHDLSAAAPKPSAPAAPMTAPAFPVAASSSFRAAAPPSTSRSSAAARPSIPPTVNSTSWSARWIRASWSIPGAINVQNGATLTLDAATLNNAGSINLLGSTSSTTLFIAHDVTLSGGGTVSMAGGHNLITDSGHSFTLTNVNDKIVGGGGLGGEFALFVVNKAGGIINGNGSGTVGELDIVATVTNAGLIEGTTSRGVAIGGSASLTTNSGTIAALGTGAFAQILETTVVNSTTKALILASGNGAQISLVDVTISGGTLKSSAGGQITGFDSSTLSGVTIAASSFLVDINDSILTLKGGTIGAGAIIETSGGTAIVSGTVTNGGTLFASATGDLIEIASGAVVNGGVALIGDGIVEFAGSSGESVRFLSNGSGGLKIADTVGHTSAFSGRVSGFGGSGHSKPVQFIDLVSVTSAGVISLSYVLRRRQHQRNAVHLQRRHDGRCHQDGRQLFGG